MITSSTPLEEEFSYSARTLLIFKFKLSTYQVSIEGLIRIGWSPSEHYRTNENPLLCDENKIDTVRRGIFIVSPNIADSQVHSFNLPRFDNRPNSDGIVPVRSLAFKFKNSVM
jgi:hypothetical protein